LKLPVSFFEIAWDKTPINKASPILFFRNSIWSYPLSPLTSKSDNHREPPSSCASHPPLQGLKVLYGFTVASGNSQVFSHLSSPPLVFLEPKNQTTSYNQNYNFHYACCTSHITIFENNIENNIFDVIITPPPLFPLEVN